MSELAADTIARMAEKLHALQERHARLRAAAELAKATLQMGGSSIHVDRAISILDAALAEGAE